MSKYTTEFSAGDPGNAIDKRCRILTPDGGVLMCCTPADAARIAAELNSLRAALDECVGACRAIVDSNSNSQRREATALCEAALATAAKVADKESK